MTSKQLCCARDHKVLRAFPVSSCSWTAGALNMFVHNYLVSCCGNSTASVGWSWLLLLLCGPAVLCCVVACRGMWPASEAE